MFGPPTALRFGRVGMQPSAPDFGPETIPNVTVADLAKAAGVSQRTFYRYFPVKKSVVALVPAPAGQTIVVGAVRPLPGGRLAATPLGRGILMFDRGRSCGQGVMARVVRRHEPTDAAWARVPSLPPAQAARGGRWTATGRPSMSATVGGRAMARSTGCWSTSRSTTAHSAASIGP